MADKAKTGDSTNVIDRVKAVIDRIKPLLQADGGDIDFVAMDQATGIVSVRLRGACQGCPGAAMTLKMGVERHLKEQVPQVKGVLAVQ